MILPSTQITIEPHGVLFVNHFNHGIQLCRVTMTLREPTLWASSVTIDAGRMVFVPLAVTEQECKELFHKASDEWRRSKKGST